MNIIKNFFTEVTRLWWMPMLTGLIAIALGIWCLCSPTTSLPVFAYAFCICLCVAGFLNITFAFANMGRHYSWGWALAYGIIELLCGIWLLALPEAAMTTAFIYAIGLFILFIAINAICESVMIYNYASFWIGWLLALLIATIICALVFLAGPIAGGVAVWIYIGVSFICYGLYRIILSAKLLRLNKRLKD